MAPSGIRWGWWKRADQSLRPFGFALGQNDKRGQKRIPCGNDKQKGDHLVRNFGCNARQAGARTNAIASSLQFGAFPVCRR